MAKYSFSSAQRYAVYTSHNEKCYICNTPIDLQSMEVDHIIPESLDEEPEKKQEILKTYGLDPHFNLNSYENWLPSCGGCNTFKSNTVFEPTPIIQLQLQMAAKKAAYTEQLAARTVTRRSVSRALNRIETALEEGNLDAEFLERLQPLITYHQQVRNQEMENEPIRITPFYEILSEENGVTTIRGPYGVGARPSGRNVDPSYDCPNCGSRGAWSGARCVVCGMMDDD